MNLRQHLFLPLKWFHLLDSARDNAVNEFRFIPALQVEHHPASVVDGYSFV